MNHLKLAHLLISSHLKKDDKVIDATCGNGKDTLFLTETLQKKGGGEIFAFDIQEIAINRTKALLLENSLLEDPSIKINFFLSSHADFSFLPKKISLIVYNLGYLPLSDHSITTQAESTLSSLKQALALILPEGSICLTCYPGHMEGKRELDEIISFLKTLEGYKVFHFHPLKESLSPCLFWIEAQS